MNRVEELIATRNHIIQTINMEFDVLIQQAMAEAREPAAPADYETIYPLTAGTALFKGRKPTGVILKNNRRMQAITWKMVAEILLRDCAQDRDRLAVMESLCDKVGGKKRVFLSKSAETMKSPIEINPHLYFESHYDTESLLRILMQRIFDAVGYDYSGIRVALQN